MLFLANRAMYCRVCAFLVCPGNIHVLGEFSSLGTRKKTFHNRLRGATGVSKSKALKISPPKHFSIIFHSSRSFRGYHLHEFDTATAGMKLSTTIPAHNGRCERNARMPRDHWELRQEIGACFHRLPEPPLFHVRSGGEFMNAGRASG